jgi:thiamine-phosphate pyrophosphorylase
MLRYAITDRLRLGADEPTRQAALLRQAARLAKEGVDFLQLREKDLPAGALADLARKLRETLRKRGSNTKLLINSRADIALAHHADGVHLTSSPGELTPGQIRALYPGANLSLPVISVSCHSLAEADAAHDAGATHILFGPVFEKRVGSLLISEGLGLAALTAACKAAAPIPVLALGGATKANTAACLSAGAAGIAAIRLFQSP